MLKKTGDIITGLSKDEENTLVKQGYLIREDAPVENNGQTVMSIKELGKHIKTVDDSAVIESLLQEEQDSGTPRKGAIMILNQRMEELKHSDDEVVIEDITAMDLDQINTYIAGVSDPEAIDAMIDLENESENTREEVIKHLEERFTALGGE